MNTYHLFEDDDNWVFGIKGNKHVWELIGNFAFCSCIYWNAPIGKKGSPLALANCQNCQGYGVPPIPLTEINWS